MAEETEKLMRIMQDANRDRNLRTPQLEMKQEMKNSVSLMVT